MRACSWRIHSRRSTSKEWAGSFGLQLPADGPRDGLKLGIRGYHGRDPARAAHCPVRGLDRVSGSPAPHAGRVPGSRTRSSRASYWKPRLHSLIGPARRMGVKFCAWENAVGSAGRRDTEARCSAVRWRIAEGQFWKLCQGDARTFGQGFYGFLPLSSPHFLPLSSPRLKKVIWLQFWKLPLDGSDGSRMEEIT